MFEDFDTTTIDNSTSQLAVVDTTPRRPNRFAQAAAVEHPLQTLENYLEKNGYDIGFGVYPQVSPKLGNLQHKKGGDTFGSWVEGQVLSWNKYLTLDIVPAGSTTQNAEQKADFRTSLDGKLTNKGESVEEYSRLMLEKHGKCEWKQRGNIYFEIFRCEDTKVQIQPDTIVILDLSLSSLNKWNQYMTKCRMSGQIGELVRLEVIVLQKGSYSWNALDFHALN